MKIPLTFILLVACPIPLHAEVRLLTGDANNNVHESSADVVDISSGGQWVALVTGPPVIGTTPGIAQGGLYLRNFSADTLEYVAGEGGTYVGVSTAAISNDARFVAWNSTADGGTGTDDHNKHIYWRDRQNDITRLITASAEAACSEPKISADGRFVTFISASRNLVADNTKLPTTNGRSAIFLYDSQTESLSIASLASDGSALTGIGAASSPPVGIYDFSKDGRYVVYSTESPNAHPDRSTMTAGFLAICRRELATGTVILLNRNDADTVINGSFNSPRLSADGNRCSFTGGFIGFFAPTTPMVTGVPASTGSDVYLKDVSSGDAWWVTETTDGTAHSGIFGTYFAISDDGTVVSYASTATKLVAEETDPSGGGGGNFDIFRTDIGAVGSVTTSLISKSPTDSGNVGYRSGPYIAGTGDYIAFNTDQVEEMTGDTSTFYQGIGVGVFPVGAGGGLSYADWAAPLPAADRDLTDNPAKDGVDNLTKYMMGMDPTKPDRNELPVNGTQPGTALGMPADTENYLTLSFRVRRDLPPGFTWVVRAGVDLAALASDNGSAIQVGAPLPDGEFDQYLFRFPTPQSSSPGRGFMDVAFEGTN